MNAPDRKAALQGMGDSRLRKEDARFIQGKGNYVDDIKLPGMVHMDIVRSPLAHARIKRINKEKALAIPGVIAVLTADDLKPLKLHWMPTLAGDVAAVLGAIAGAAVGNAVERSGTTEEAQELLLQFGNGERRTIVQGKGQDQLRPGDAVIVIQTGQRFRVVRAPARAATGAPAPAATGR